MLEIQGHGNMIISIMEIASHGIMKIGNLVIFMLENEALDSNCISHCCEKCCLELTYRIVIDMAGQLRPSEKCQSSEFRFSSELENH